MHTVKGLAVGFGLLGIFLLVGRLPGHGSRAALSFLPAWLIIAALNLWYGVTRAGYSTAEEFPIFLPPNKPVQNQRPFVLSLDPARTAGLIWTGLKFSRPWRD